MSIVTTYDSPLRFLVTSQTRAEISHLVDLTAWRSSKTGTCNGRCSCEHFTMRLEPKLRRGAQPSPLLRCTHIEIARDKFITQMLVKIASVESAAKQSDPNQPIQQYDEEEGP